MNLQSQAGPQSLKFQIDEVLSGMLATLPVDTFADDPATLGATFKGLSASFTLFTPFAALADGLDYSKILSDGLEEVVRRGRLRHEGGSYVLTPEGRTACVSNKRTLFNVEDIAQLEEAARYFAQRQAPLD